MQFEITGLREINFNNLERKNEKENNYLKDNQGEKSRNNDS